MNVEQRLARLEALEDIRQLKAKYFYACDHKQPQRVAECFAPGQIDLQYGRIGSFNTREDMVAVFIALACQEHIVEMHHGQNPQIEIHDDTRASATWGLYYYLIDTRGETVTQLAGVYEDDYICIDGQWLICKSWYEVTSTQIFDLSAGLAKVIFAGRAAPQELDDPSQQAG